MSRLQTVLISTVKVEGRTRRSFGDLGKLAASIDARGLLHPPAVLTDLTLVAGLRRLRACESLGWTHIEVLVVSSIADEMSALMAEGEENDCREPFTPSEAVEHASKIQELERELAAQRAAEGAARANAERARMAAEARSAGAIPLRPKQDETARKSFPSRPQVEGQRSDARVAKAVGMSRPTLHKAQQIVEATKSPDRVIADAAKRAVERMDTTGKVDGAFKELRKVADEATIAKADALSAGDVAYLEERRVTKLRKIASELSYKHGIGLLKLDPDAVAAVIDPADIPSWDALAKDSAAWFNRFLLSARLAEVTSICGGTK